jgi:hypothetical protein
MRENDTTQSLKLCHLLKEGLAGLRIRAIELDGLKVVRFRQPIENTNWIRKQIQGDITKFGPE